MTLHSKQNTTPILQIKNLKAGFKGLEIIKGLNLTIYPGEVHAIMGPNGSGKSTLSNILAGHESYDIMEGVVEFNGKNLFELEPEERAGEGLFLAFQYPVELPGLGMSTFLKNAVNEIRAYRRQEPLDTKSFLAKQKQIISDLEMDPDFLKRSVNEGFSGGEKKKCEVLQMMMLEPSFIIMDETDSGLDLDALKMVSRAINSFKNSERSFLIITHYSRLLEYIKPDFVHIMDDGKLIQSGTYELAKELELKGYDSFKIAAINN